MNVKLPSTHCSNCGGEYDPFEARDGYTGCCNEPVCRGDKGMLARTDLWACKNPADTSREPKIIEKVRACCGAAAELAAEAKGLTVAWMLR